MDGNLGSLGNVDMYFVLKDYNEDIIKALLNQVPFELQDVHWNNLVQGKSRQVDFNSNLFNRQINAGEEIFFRYQLGDNYVCVILLQERAVVYIHFRAWYFLEKQLIIIIERLLTNYELIVLGFELNFDYDDTNLRSALNKLKTAPFNYPYIQKELTENKIEIFCDDEITGNLDLLNLLKMKIHPVFEMIG